MSASSVLSEAGAALRFNKQRSILTMICLGWGVTCFVILYSYGEGFDRALTQAFRAVGHDLILMFGGNTSTQAGGEKAGRGIRLELSDVEAIRTAVPMIEAISPEIMIRNTNVVRGYRSQNIRIRAVAASYGRVRNMTMAQGRWIGEDDQTQKQRVAVIGAKAAEKMFGEIPPTGEDLRINGLSFTVVGVLKTKTQISNYNTPDNDCLFIPYETASLFANTMYPEDIVWSPKNPIFRKDAIKQVRGILARVHNFSPNDDRAVEILAFNDFLKMITTMGAALRILLGIIGALTLAIGGVGLANIMLVSVTQRTREIGTLKSLGATRRAILWQFLAEALAIVTAGGLLGVLLGWVVTISIGNLPLLGPLFKDTTGQGDVHLELSTFAVVTSTLMLELVGLIAGLLPAIKAARLSPIEALRYE
jgi:putative ABC transport system permease protein